MVKDKLLEFKWIQARVQLDLQRYDEALSTLAQIEEQQPATSAKDDDDIREVKATAQELRSQILRAKLEHGK